LSEIVLGFQRVDDGRRAHLEVALGLGELLGDGAVLRIGERHVVLREEHVEIRLRHAQDQVLLRAGESRLGLDHLLLRLVDGDPALQAEDRLRERDRVGLGGEVAVGRAVALGVVAEDRGAAREERQVGRSSLRQLLQARHVLRARGLVDGIAHLRVAVDRDEVCGAGAAERGADGGGPWRARLQRVPAHDDHGRLRRAARGVEGQAGVHSHPRSS